MLLGGVIAAATMLMLSKLRNDAIVDGGRELENLALVLAEYTDRAFQSVALVEANLLEQAQARRPVTHEDFERQMSGQAVHLMLRDKASGMPHVGSLTLINADGKLINFSRFWPLPTIDVTDRDFFQALKSNSQLTYYLGEPVLNRATGSWTLHLVRRVSGPHGEFFGLILGAMEMDYFERYFGTIALGEGSSITLIRQDGRFLARYPHVENGSHLSFGGSPLFKDVLAKAQSGVSRLTSLSDGQDRLVAGRKLTNYPLVMAVGRPVRVILADWNHQATYLISAALATVLLVGSVIWLSARQLTARLHENNEQLMSAINNMSQGLCMFDATARLVVCNERYRQVYGLSSEVVTPGCSLRDLLGYRKEVGTFSGDAEQYAATLISEMAQGKTTDYVGELADGRSIAVVNWPMAGGGWVATHEDITESKRREASFRLLFENSPVPMWVYDVETLRFLAVNDAAVAHYGYSRDQYRVMTVYDIRPVEDHERFRQFMQTDRGVHEGEQIWRHRKADGTDIEAAVYSRSLTYEGRSAALVAVHDVTSVRRADRQREQTERFLNAIIENIPVSIIVKEPHDRRYVLINRAAEELYGISRERVIGKTPDELFAKPTADLIRANDEQSLKFPHQLFFHSREVETPANGNHKIATKRLTILSDDGKPEYLLGLVEDITERARAEERIAHMAHHDALTDLPNRALLRERLDTGLAFMRRGDSLAVHYLDLDHFKSINDTLGHGVGDELLKVVAERLRGCVRDSDTVARLGGDEFAIVQIGLADITDAADMAQRILDLFKAPFELNGHHVTTDVSVGIAIAPNDGTDVDQLLKNADLALYGAKADGRGTYRFFESEMDVRMKARHSLEIDLRHALAKGEFELHYQPQINLLSNQVCGCEALLRWHHPERGMISPTEFIPVAEETGLIVALGEWVVRQACTDAATWPADVKVAINISPAQLMNQNLLPMVVNALAASGLKAARLEFEITEAVLLQNNDRTMATLHQLRELGARIALDDFGTGYSSLSYLRRFPFDKIKIDRSFIQDLAGEGGALAIVQAIMNLAFSLNMTTTAEGVETEEQLEIVRALGCTELQGFLFSSARPAKDVRPLFERQVRLASVA
jgi:diguanylate cyclase (GGDEF)-like protein/PAS domain S-box-containing protein